MSDIRTKEILAQLIEDLSLAIIKAKAQLEYVDNDSWVVEQYKKYDENGNVKPQEPDALTSLKARSARIFKEVRDRVTSDPIYQRMRKLWRENE